MKKNSFVFLIWILSIFSSMAGASDSTRYKLIWNYEGMKIEVKTFRAPLAMLSRVGESGILDGKVKLPIQGIVKNNTLTLGKNEKGILYLFVKNNGKKKLNFSVAPHSTEPGASAMGFSFKCLCNGHVYEVGPGETWYRVMMLNIGNTLVSSEPEIVLTHEVFEVKVNAKQTPQPQPNRN